MYTCPIGAKHMRQSSRTIVSGLFTQIKLQTGFSALGISQSEKGRGYCCIQVLGSDAVLSLTGGISE